MMLEIKLSCILLLVMQFELKSAIDVQDELCYGNICFQIVKTDYRLNWRKAINACRSLGLEGGVFFNKEQMVAVSETVEALNVEMWVGLKIDQSLLMWEWYEGGRISGVTLSVSSGGTGHCISLNKGILYMDNCNNGYRCLCQKPSVNQDLCARLGGVLFSEHCVYDTKQLNSWVGCARRCAHEEGQLATHAIVNNLGIASHTSQADFYGNTTWIGVSRARLNWARPSPLDPFTLPWSEIGYVNPDYEALNKQCMQVADSSGLKSTACSRKLQNVLCLKAPPNFVFEDPTTTTHAPTTTTSETTTVSTTIPTTTPTTVSTLIPTTVTTTVTTTMPTTVSTTIPTTVSTTVTTVPTTVSATSEQTTTLEMSTSTTQQRQSTANFTEVDLKRGNVSESEGNLVAEHSAEDNTKRFPVGILVGSLVAVLLLAAISIAIVTGYVSSRRRRRESKFSSLSTSSLNSRSINFTTPLFLSSMKPVEHGTMTTDFSQAGTIRTRSNSVDSEPTIVGPYKAQEEFTYPTALTSADSKCSPTLNQLTTFAGDDGGCGSPIPSFNNEELNTISSTCKSANADAVLSKGSSAHGNPPYAITKAFPTQPKDRSFNRYNKMSHQLRSNERNTESYRQKNYSSAGQNCSVI